MLRNAGVTGGEGAETLQEREQRLWRLLQDAGVTVEKLRDWDVAVIITTLLRRTDSLLREEEQFFRNKISGWKTNSARYEEVVQTNKKEVSVSVDKTFLSFTSVEEAPPAAKRASSEPPHRAGVPEAPRCAGMAEPRGGAAAQAQAPQPKHDRNQIIVGVIEYLQEQRLPMNLTNVAKYLPKLFESYSVDKKDNSEACACPEVFTCKEVENIVRGHCPGFFIGKQGWRVPNRTQPKAAVPDEHIMADLEHLRSEWDGLMSLPRTAALLQRSGAYCKKQRLGDLEHQLQQLVRDGQILRPRENKGALSLRL